MGLDSTALRARFEGLDDGLHLVSHSLGAMPCAAREAMVRHADAWAQRSVTAWDEWFPAVRYTADRLARITGAPDGSVVLHQNVSALLAGILSALRPTPARNRVVTSARDFPTVRYVLAAHADLGFEVVPVDSDDAAELAAAIDERTLLVAVSHVFFGTSTLLDPAPIVAAARRHGALVLLDAYQSVGTVPVDVEALDVDFLVGGSIKWLCGGPGVGYAYVRPDVAATLHPRATGWIAHAKPFAFEPLLREAAGAWRFVGGTPSPLAVAVARAGYDVIIDLKAADVRAHSLALTRRLMDGVRELGCTVRTPDDDARRGGTVVFDFDGSADACRVLLSRRIWLDHRPGYGLRVSPHVYTRPDEIDAFVAALGEVMGRSTGAGAREMGGTTPAPVSDLEVIERCFAPIRDLPCWLAKHGHGSSLTFEFGKPRLEVLEPRPPRPESSPKVNRLRAERRVWVKGDWHLWIYCCHWRLFEKTKQLAHSESSAAVIGRAVATLDGQKLQVVEVNPATGDTVFRFDLGGRIETRRYDRDHEQWMLYQPSGYVLAVRGDGQFSLQSGMGHEDWEPLSAPGDAAPRARTKANAPRRGARRKTRADSEVSAHPLRSPAPRTRRRRGSR